MESGAQNQAQFLQLRKLLHCKQSIRVGEFASFLTKWLHSDAFSSSMQQLVNWMQKSNANPN